MHPASYATRLSLGRRPRRRHPAPRGDRPTARARRARGRCGEQLRRLPREAHAVPYVVLALFGAVLLLPGVVPQGPSCGDSYGAASVGERLLFIRLSAVGFGIVAALLLLSAVAASARRAGRRPGLPTVVSASLVGVVTIAAVIWPHDPVAVPAQAAMFIDVIALIVTRGGALAVPVVAVVIAWSTLRGPRFLRAAQILAWVTLLVALPLIMALTYLTVTPVCLG